MGRERAVNCILLPVVAAALLAACMLLIPQAAQAKTYDNAYGQLCARFESGTDPACIDANCAYGAYQMSTSCAHGMADYLSDKKAYKDWGALLSAAYERSGYCGKYFDAAWRQLAGAGTKSDKKLLKKCLKAAKLDAVPEGDASEFLHQQYLYVKKSYYSQAVKLWKKALKGFKPSSYSTALKNVIFSTAVQHGPSGSVSNILKPAMKAVGGWKKGMGEKAFIKAIYAERSRAVSKKELKKELKKKGVSSPSITVIKASSLSGICKTIATKYELDNKVLAHFYSSSAVVQVGVYNRLGVNERAAALELYKKYA